MQIGTILSQALWLVLERVRSFQTEFSQVIHTETRTDAMTYIRDVAEVFRRPCITGTADANRVRRDKCNIVFIRYIDGTLDFALDSVAAVFLAVDYGIRL